MGAMTLKKRSTSLSHRVTRECHGVGAGFKRSTAIVAGLECASMLRVFLKHSTDIKLVTFRGLRILIGAADMVPR